VALLEVAGLSRRFGGLMAVNALDLEVERGELLGLIGPNGAGKSTLLDVQAGLRAYHGGSLLLDGTELRSLRAADFHELVALVATARWTSPVTTVSSGLAEARVERAARETVFALSYVSRCARMTGEIVADEVLEKRVAGTVGRAIDAGVVEHGLNPPLRRAMKKSGLVETKPVHERS